MTHIVSVPSKHADWLRDTMDPTACPWATRPLSECVPMLRMVCTAQGYAIVEDNGGGAYGATLRAFSVQAGQPLFRAVCSMALPEVASLYLRGVVDALAADHAAKLKGEATPVIADDAARAARRANRVCRVRLTQAVWGASSHLYYGASETVDVIWYERDANFSAGWQIVGCGFTIRLQPDQVTVVEDNR